jgi:DNA-binding PadR family transcriptional regulator
MGSEPPTGHERAACADTDAQSGWTLVRPNPTESLHDMSNLDMSEMDLSKPIPVSALYILVALIPGDCHGYAIMQSVRERTDGRVPLGTGSLYRYLAKLIDAGLVTEVEHRGGTDDPRRGVSSRLTARGKQALAAERQRLTDLIGALDAFRPASRKGST